MKIKFVRSIRGRCIPSVTKSPRSLERWRWMIWGLLSKTEESAQRMQWEFAVMFLLRISWEEACDTQHTDGVKPKLHVSKHWLFCVRQLYTEKWVIFTESAELSA